VPSDAEGLRQPFAEERARHAADPFDVQTAALVVRIVVLERIVVSAEKVEHVAVVIVAVAILVAGSVKSV
jgi:hypothetical protein